MNQANSDATRPLGAKSKIGFIFAADGLSGSKITLTARVVVKWAW
ncbi:MAG: hypothetical protein ACO1RT_09530 [Planctomycetaceae bacterium]